MDKYLYNTPMLTSMITGWLMGRRIAGHTTKRKVPIAYLYNGVRLPALPEWDREMYPYGLLSQDGYTGYYWLWAFSQPIHYSYNAFGGNSFYPPKGAEGIGFVYKPVTDTEWPTKPEQTEAGFFGVDPFWANYDIQHEDGAVVLAASEPVPVYE